MENEDWLDEDDEGTESAEEFEVGDLVVLYTRTPTMHRGEELNVELGQLMGFVPEGVLFRRTHRRVFLVDQYGRAIYTKSGERDWEFAELQRSILTFVHWRIVDRLESSLEVTQEIELGDFADLMSKAQPEDITAGVEADDE